MRAPCDAAAIRAEGSASTCPAAAKTWVLAVTILASSMAFIDSTVVNVTLPAIQNRFHATVIDVQWVVEAYGLFLGALILTGGSLGDVFGRRRIFVAGVAIFAVASAGCGFALSIRHLIIARSIQGVGAALLVPGSLAIISASFEDSSRGQAIGTWSGFTAITTAIGPVLGGWLVQHASWRWAFFLNLPLAASVIAISLWHVPESHSANANRVDWWGAALGTAGLGGVVYGFIESSNLGWSNAWVLGSLTTGCVCLVVFALVEARVTSPMVPMKLFSSPAFSGANLLTLFLYSAIGIFFFLFPLNLIQVQHYSSTSAGGAMLPLILLMFLLSRWSGGLVAHFGQRIPLVVGPLIAASGFALFAVPSVGGPYWKLFLPAVIVLGMGLAVTVAPLTTVVMNSIGEDRVGAASGINNAVARVAGVLAIAVLGIVVLHTFSYRLNQRIADLPITPDHREEIKSNEIKLAALQIPSGIDAHSAQVIRESVGQAFVFGFRVIMWICVALSVGSAAVAWLMIPARNHLLR